MLTSSTHKLQTLQGLFPTLAEVAQDAVGAQAAGVVVALENYARRGMDCVVMRDGDTVAGYTLFGPMEKFPTAAKQIAMLVRLRQAGYGELYLASHVHLRKAYWKTGTHTALLRAVSQATVAAGVSHMLLWGFATDALAEWWLKQPGAKPLDGVTDLNDRQVGVHDLDAFLTAIEAVEGAP